MGNKSTQIQTLFFQAKQTHTSLFFPYICLGYPSFEKSLEIAETALTHGAHGLEIGVPFSDPIADGPVLQRANFYSLQKGTRPQDAFRFMKILRSRGFQQPLLLMSYANPMEHLGWKVVAQGLSKVQAQGIIVPDWPLSQIPPIQNIFKPYQLKVIPFLSPTSDVHRQKQVDALQAPFLYYVSVTGVTGARKSISKNLIFQLRRLNQSMKTPIGVGFGISTPQQAQRIGQVAQGIIIASALIELIEKASAGQIVPIVKDFCRKISVAIQKSPVERI
jgi:tryptophan synthase alpha chain